jgi:hypothetical protein
MKRKVVQRKEISDLNIQNKKLNIKKIFDLIKKIGTPYTKDEEEQNRYSTA